VRFLGLVFAVAVTLVAFYAFASGFFYYMDQHGALPAEPCVGAGVDFDEMDCRGHYGFENDLLVPHLWIAGVVGALLALGGEVAVRRYRSRGSGSRPPK
jgi:hypothetical protein